MKKKKKPWNDDLFQEDSNIQSTINILISAPPEREVQVKDLA